jgi:hemoglobin
MSEASLYDRLGGSPKLELLLRNFYASLQEHPVLGPIFSQHVQDWPSHLFTVREFWALQTGGPSIYRGGMAARHVPLRLQPEHFDQWLAQWAISCRAHFDPREAEELIGIAQKIGERLRQIVRNVDARQ